MVMPAFPLQIHGIEQLILHIPLCDRAGRLQQPVRERRLPVVDVGNDTKIASQAPGHPRAALFFSPEHTSTRGQPTTPVAPTNAGSADNADSVGNVGNGGTSSAWKAGRISRPEGPWELSPGFSLGCMFYIVLGL